MWCSRSGSNGCCRVGRSRVLCHGAANQTISSHIPVEHCHRVEVESARPPLGNVGSAQVNLGSEGAVPRLAAAGGSLARCHTIALCVAGSAPAVAHHRPPERGKQLLQQQHPAVPGAEVCVSLAKHPFEQTMPASDRFAARFAGLVGG